MCPDKTIFLFLIVAGLMLLPSCVKNLPSQKNGIGGQGAIYTSVDYVLVKSQNKKDLKKLARIHLGDSKWAWKIEDANDTSKISKASLVTIPLKENHLGGIFENGYQSVPILCYHRFGMGKNPQ